METGIFGAWDILLYFKYMLNILDPKVEKHVAKRMKVFVLKISKLFCLNRDDIWTIYVSTSLIYRMSFVSVLLLGQWFSVSVSDFWPGFWSVFQRGRLREREKKNKTSPSSVIGSVSAHQLGQGHLPLSLMLVRDIVNHRLLIKCFLVFNFIWDQFSALTGYWGCLGCQGLSVNLLDIQKLVGTD